LREALETLLREKKGGGRGDVSNGAAEQSQSTGEFIMVQGEGGGVVPRRRAKGKGGQIVLPRQKDNWRCRGPCRDAGV